MTQEFTPNDIEQIAQAMRKGTEWIESNYPPDEGDISGDREPINPLPIVPRIGSMALQLPV